MSAGELLLHVFATIGFGATVIGVVNLCIKGAIIIGKFHNMEKDFKELEEKFRKWERSK